MLRNIRKMADNFAIKILLAVIVVSFIAFGIQDVLQRSGDFDLVTFSDAKNISHYDFLKAKSEEIAAIQKQNNLHLSEEDIKELAIDQTILQRMINTAILDYIVKYYDLDLSEKRIIQFIKQAPIFNNANKEFDIQIFRSIIGRSSQTEMEYLRHVKEEMLKNIMLHVFTEGLHVPEIMINNLANYATEKRTLDLVQIDLQIAHGNLTAPKPDLEQLRTFYDQHQDLFAVKEKRSFSYISIPESVIKKKIKISAEELADFFQDNIDEFGGQDVNKVKKLVENTLTQQKFEELSIELSKNLEDEVAGGSSLQEIAEKYDLTMGNLVNVTYDDIINSKTPISTKVANIIFEMTDQEVSYPIANDSEILLVAMNSITSSDLESFDQALSKAEKLWVAEFLRDANLKQINELAKEYGKKQMNYDRLKPLGIKINKNLLISRSRINDTHNSIPHDLMLIAFNAKSGTNTPVIIYNNKGYFAHVKSIKINNITMRNSTKNEELDIAKTIKYGIIEEMIQHFIQINKIKIRQHTIE